MKGVLFDMPKKTKTEAETDDAKPSVKGKRLTDFPEIAAQWHPTKNGDLRPEDVSAGSGKKVWWKCPVADDHEWAATIANRAGRGSGCPAWQ